MEDELDLSGKKLAENAARTATLQIGQSVSDQHDIPVPPHEQKPSGCPDHGARSTVDCAGPLNSSVCQEFCSKVLHARPQGVTLPR